VDDGGVDTRRGVAAAVAAAGVVVAVAVAVAGVADGTAIHDGGGEKGGSEEILWCWW